VTLVDCLQQAADRMRYERNLEIDIVADAAEPAVVADSIEHWLASQMVQIRAVELIVVALPNIVSDFMSKKLHSKLSYHLNHPSPAELESNQFRVFLTVRERLRGEN
jgi:hypothetical protein